MEGRDAGRAAARRELGRLTRVALSTRTAVEELRRPPVVAMMQPAQDLLYLDVARFGRLNGSRHWTVLLARDESSCDGPGPGSQEDRPKATEAILDRPVSPPESRSATIALKDFDVVPVGRAFGDEQLAVVEHEGVTSSNTMSMIQIHW